MPRAFGVLVAVAMLVACQQPAAGPQSSSVQNQISGAASCSSAEGQDLTFSGSVVGHVVCSTSPATCLPGYGLPGDRDRTGVSLPLDAKIGSTPVQLNIDFRKSALGEFAAGPLGDNEAFSGDDGVTFDGNGHWSTPVNAGPMTLATFDSTSAAGTVDVKLNSGSKTITVKGSWRCVKPPGF